MSDRERVSSDDLIRQAWSELGSHPDPGEAPPPEPESAWMEPDPETAVSPREASSTATGPLRARTPERPSTPLPEPRSRRPAIAAVLGLGIALAGGIAIFFAGGSESDGTSEAATAPTVATVRSTVFFDGFSDAEGLSLTGSATQLGDVVELTDKVARTQAGAMWFSDPQPVADGFETAFVFQIDHVSTYTIGDGFAFVIQRQGTFARGGGASGNGYDGIAPSLAVEFDTVRHDYMGDPWVRTPAGSPPRLSDHVAIHSGGFGPTRAHTDHQLAFTGLHDVDLYDRRPHLALIRYEPGTLEVFVDDLEVPVLTATVHIDRLLGMDDATAYVGFTAGTEDGYYAGHRIVAWELNSPCLPITGCGDTGQAG